MRAPAAKAREWINPVDGMRFVWVPAGTDPLAKDGKISGFWMGRTEVTVAQYTRFAKATGYRTDAERTTNRWTWRKPGFRQRGSHPAVFLTAEDALAYTRWAGVDLPSEVEWLYACRAGSTQRYYWGETLDSRYAWYRTNSEEGSQPAGKKLPNAWGLHDMVGNVWEYCKASRCEPGHQCYSSRGSSWSRCPSYLTRQGTVAENLVAVALQAQLDDCALKSGLVPYPANDDRGFRCIRRPSPPPKTSSPVPSS